MCVADYSSLFGLITYRLKGHRNIDKDCFYDESGFYQEFEFDGVNQVLVKDYVFDGVSFVLVGTLTKSYEVSSNILIFASGADKIETQHEINPTTSGFVYLKPFSEGRISQLNQMIFKEV